MLERIPLPKPMATLRSFWQRPAVRRVTQIGWMLFIILFVAVAMYRNWDVIGDMEWTLRRFSFLFLAILAALLRKLMAGFSSTWIIQLLGEKKISLQRGLKVYFQSNLAMYVPGTYWFIPSRIMMLRQNGISAIQASVSILLEQLLIALSGAIIGLWGLPHITSKINQTTGYIWFGLVVFVGLIMTHPWSLNTLVNLIGRLLKREVSTIDLSHFKVLLLLLSYVLFWMVGALSFFFQARIFDPSLPIVQAGLFAAIFSSSWLIGFLVPIAPNGLVVREGVMGLGLSAIGIPATFIVFIVALSRFMFILEDVVWGLISLFIVNAQAVQNT